MIIKDKHWSYCEYGTLTALRLQSGVGSVFKIIIYATTEQKNQSKWIDVKPVKVFYYEILITKCCLFLFISIFSSTSEINCNEASAGFELGSSDHHLGPSKSLPGLYLALSATLGTR